MIDKIIEKGTETSKAILLVFSLIIFSFLCVSVVAAVANKTELFQTSTRVIIAFLNLGIFPGTYYYMSKKNVEITLTKYIYYLIAALFIVTFIYIALWITFSLTYDALVNAGSREAFYIFAYEQATKSSWISNLVIFFIFVVGLIMYRSWYNLPIITIPEKYRFNNKETKKEKDLKDKGEKNEDKSTKS